MLQSCQDQNHLLSFVYIVLHIVTLLLICHNYPRMYLNIVISHLIFTTSQCNFSPPITWQPWTNHLLFENLNSNQAYLHTLRKLNLNFDQIAQFTFLFLMIMNFLQQRINLIYIPRNFANKGIPIDIKFRKMSKVIELVKQ